MADDTIREAAYLKWQSEGQQHGRALDHWLQAEREVLTIIAQSIAGSIGAISDVSGGADQKNGIVLFLGSGFSKSIGNLPVGRDLFNKIIEKGELSDSAKFAIKRLFPSETYDTMQLENLLAIVQRLKRQQATRRPPIPGIECPNALWRELAVGVGRVTHFDAPQYVLWQKCPKLRRLIDFLGCASSKATVSIVTTNYDLIADKVALYVTDKKLGYNHSGPPKNDLRRYQYGYPIRSLFSTKDDLSLDTTGTPWAKINGISVYKLHGSTNWAYCRYCKALDLSATKADMSEILLGAAKCANCGNIYEYLIVPPVPNKDIGGREVLEKVWQEAEKALEAAKLVIFVGYSFPPEDPLVLEMVATARLRSAEANGKPWIFCVFDRTGRYTVATNVLLVKDFTL